MNENENTTAADTATNAPEQGGNLVVVAAAIVCVATFSCASSLVLPVLTLSMEARGISSAVIGAFGAMLGLTAMAITFFIPQLVRRLGARNALTTALFITATAMLSYKLTEQWLAAWFVIYVVYCAALGLMFVVSESVITAAAPAARRNFILGLYATGFSGGFAMGPLILLVTGVEGWAPFIAGSAFSLAAAVFVFFGIRGETIPPPKAVDLRQMGGYFTAMARRAPLPFAAAAAVGAMEISVYDFLPVYASKTGHDVDGAVLLISVFSIGSLAIVPLVTAIADKYRPLVVLFIVAILCFLGGAFLPAILAGARNEIPASWILLALWGGMIMALYPLGLVQMARSFPGGNLVGGNSLFGLSYGFGAFSGPLIVGAAMDIQVHGIAILAAFAVLPLFFMRRGAVS